MNLKLQKSFLFLIQELASVIKRFTLPVLCSISFCILSLKFFPEIKDTFRYLSILFTGCFWFISFKLYTESKRWSLSHYYLIGVPVFAALAWYLYTLSSWVYVFSFLGLGLFLSMFIAPFLKKDATSAHIWRFNYDLCLHIFFTILTAFVLYLVIVSTLSSLHFLFGIQFYNKIYLDTWLIIATLFSPIMAMSGIHNRFDAIQEPYPEILRFILSYIILPFLLIYTLILYAYTAVILVSWSLPKGGVAYLVSAFGCIGMITYLASHHLHKTSAYFSFFKRYFFYIICVPLILLGTGIGMRIYECGITESRYAVLICFIWFFLSTLFALIKKQEKMPQFIQASAVCLLMASSFGPWGVEQMSEWSQTQRLEYSLKKNGVLIEGKIHKLSKPLERSESISIISMVDYLISRKKTLPLKTWFANVPDSKINDHPEKITSQEIIEDMGINYVHNAHAPSYHFELEPHKPLTIKGYDHYLPFHKNKIDDLKNFVLDGKTMGLSFDDTSNHLIITKEDTKETITLDLTPIFEFLKQRPSHDQIQESDLTVAKNGQSFNVRLTLTNVFGVRETNKIDSFSAALLIKMK